MSIHDEIKRLRKLKRLSQERLAELVSAQQPNETPITRQTIAHWERGATAPKRTRLPAVAEVLGTTVESLLSGSEIGLTSTSPTSDATGSPTLADALSVVAQALGELPAGRWTMVRARLDDLVGHPEMHGDVVADVLPLLTPAARFGKRPLAA